MFREIRTRERISEEEKKREKKRKKEKKREERRRELENIARISAGAKMTFEEAKAFLESLFTPSSHEN